MANRMTGWGGVVAGLMLAATSLHAQTDLTRPAAGVDVARPILDADPAFDRYVNLDLLADAWEDKNAELLTDLALQLSEGERILQRTRKGIRAEDVFAAAIRTASGRRDTATLDRLARVLGTMKRTDLVSQVVMLRRLAGASRAIDPGLAVQADAASPAVFLVLQANLEEIASAKVAGDRAGLADIAKSIPDLTQLSESQRRALAKAAAEALESMPATVDPATASLNKLLDESRASRGGGRSGGSHPSGSHPSGTHPSGSHPSGSHPSGSHPGTGGISSGSIGKGKTTGGTTTGGTTTGGTTTGGTTTGGTTTTGGSTGKGKTTGVGGTNVGGIGATPGKGKTGTGTTGTGTPGGTTGTGKGKTGGGGVAGGGGTGKGKTVPGGLKGPRPNPVVIRDYVRSNFRSIGYVRSVWGFTIGGGRRIYISDSLLLDPGDVIVRVGRISCANTTMSLDDLIAQAVEDGDPTMAVRDVNTGEEMVVNLSDLGGE